MSISLFKKPAWFPDRTSLSQLIVGVTAIGLSLSLLHIG